MMNDQLTMQSTDYNLLEVLNRIRSPKSSFHGIHGRVVLQVTEDSGNDVFSTYVNFDEEVCSSYNLMIQKGLNHASTNVGETYLCRELHWLEC
jgi:hypothetical protein